MSSTNLNLMLDPIELQGTDVDDVEWETVVAEFATRVVHIECGDGVEIEVVDGDVDDVALEKVVVDWARLHKLATVELDMGYIDAALLLLVSLWKRAIGAGDD